jgi:plasmid stabilization system protein ParE
VKIKILPSALADLDRGRKFYVRQGKSVGDYFLDSLFSDIDSLEIYAGVHAKVYGFHRLLSKRFPYAAYYKVDGDVFLVFHVLDCRQRPAKTRDTLK